MENFGAFSKNYRDGAPVVFHMYNMICWDWEFDVVMVPVCLLVSEYLLGVSLMYWYRFLYVYLLMFYDY